MTGNLNEIIFIDFKTNVEVKLSSFIIKTCTPAPSKKYPLFYYIFYFFHRSTNNSSNVTWCVSFCSQTSISKTVTETIISSKRIHWTSFSGSIHIAGCVLPFINSIFHCDFSSFVYLLIRTYMKWSVKSSIICVMIQII